MTKNRWNGGRFCGKNAEGQAKGRLRRAVKEWHKEEGKIKASETATGPAGPVFVGKHRAASWALYCRIAQLISPIWLCR